MIFRISNRKLSGPLNMLVITDDPAFSLRSTYRSKTLLQQSCIEEQKHNRDLTVANL